MAAVDGSIVALALCIAIVAGCGAARLDVSAIPPDVRGAYAVFEMRCSKCHGLARPLNARISSMDHWRSYVRRMRRMPGSGISAEDGAEILRFLEYYTYEVRGVPRPENEEADAREGGGDG